MDGNIHTVLATLNDNDSIVTETIKEMFQVGGAMFATAIYFLVAQDILGDPPSHAEWLIDDCPVAKPFKSKPGLSGLKTMLTSACVVDSPLSKAASSSQSASAQFAARKHLLKELLETWRAARAIIKTDVQQDVHDDGNQVPPTHRNKGKGKGKKKTTQRE